MRGGTENRQRSTEPDTPVQPIVIARVGAETPWLIEKRLRWHVSLIRHSPRRRHQSLQLYVLTAPAAARI